MIKKVTHILLSTWLAMLLLFGTTPMEFVHQFTGHKDTVDHYHKGLELEPKHHHCAFVGFNMLPFDGVHLIPFLLPASLPGFLQVHAAIKNSYIQRCIIITSLRAPPAFA